MSVVITGVGCISPIGEGEREVCCNLRRLHHGFRMKVTSRLRRRTEKWCAGWVRKDCTSNVPAALQFASRGALLAYRAARLALFNARVKLNDGVRDRCAVVLGTAFGSIESVHRFDAEALRNGSHYVNSMLFPNTVINAPAGYLGACLGLRGANMTVSTGLSSSLSAVVLGQEMLLMGQADVVLAGGYDELSPLLLSIAADQHLLKPDLAHRPSIPRPLDRRRNGWVLGEGAAVLVLEKSTRAVKRGATILAKIAGSGRHFSNGDAREPAKRALAMSLSGRQLKEPDRVAVFLGANGSKDGDRTELDAAEDVIGEPVHATAPKSFFGESGGGNAVALAIAVWALKRGFVPPTLGFQSADHPLTLQVAKAFTRKPLEAVLVNVFDPLGEHASLLLEAVEG